MPQLENNFDKFSNNYKKSLKAAAELAIELNHRLIEPQHILYGLIIQRGSVGAELFTALKVKADEVKNRIAQAHELEQKAEAKVAPVFSPASRVLIQKSVQIAYLNRHKYVGTEHLLAALLQSENEEVKKLFKILKVSEMNLATQVTATLKGASKLPDLTELFKAAEKKQRDFFDDDFDDEPASALELFGNNLTSPKFQERVDPVIGREEEISRIIQILSRRTKNNPIILGEPGVGKTAIVEGLAKKIMAGEVPEALHGKKIYALDLTAAVAGTMYRGEFEARVKQIIDEVREKPEIILFIDEIHNLVGAGAASGSMDAANILKPALSRGEIRCIGATTFADYRKSIENDPALDRRFQAVRISEPSAEETKKILLGIREFFEKFHRVRVSDEAVDAAIVLSQRYLPEKFLPDKAIDLIDEASAGIKVDRGLSILEKQIKEIEIDLNAALKAKEEAIVKEDFALALELKKRAEDAANKLTELQKKQAEEKSELAGEIGAQEVARIIARITGIPVEDLAASEKKRILALDKLMKEKIIGQDQAVENIAEFMKRAKAGLMPENKPLASFMLFGPSGAGKTYTARTLAKALFSDENALIKIDMSEYGERFNISKLIGAPAGYVGYKESGHLTEKVKHKPYSIVLFDEIEKANPDVFDLLLQVLDDGYLTDAAGSRINFRNTVVMMTSNIGSRFFAGKDGIGFDADKEKGQLNYFEEKIVEEAKNYFKPEFLNRLDKIIYFNPLSLADLEKIAKLELLEVGERLLKQNIGLKASAGVFRLIATKSRGEPASPNRGEQGARAIKKTIQELVETPLSQKLLAGKINSGDTIRLTAKNDIIEISL